MVRSAVTADLTMSQATFRKVARHQPACLPEPEHWKLFQRMLAGWLEACVLPYCGGGTPTYASFYKLSPSAPPRPRPRSSATNKIRSSLLLYWTLHGKFTQLALCGGASVETSGMAVGAFDMGRSMASIFNAALPSVMGLCLATLQPMSNT